ncbi:MAG TPA: ATP-dependent helicase, partial [Nitrososphaerales archaeon]
NGASHKRIEEFIKDYSPNVIQLPMNYRCPPEIVKLANNLIRHNFLRTIVKKPLEAFRPSLNKSTTIRLLPVFSNSDAEAIGVTKDIKNIHSDHLDLVVVLGRNRKLLESVELALRREGLPAVISQRKDEFESTPLLWLHSILRLANDRQNRRHLEAVCGTFSQLTKVEVDLEYVIRQAQASNRDYLQYWARIVLQKDRSALVMEIIEQTLRFLGDGRDFRMFSKFALGWFNNLIQAKQQTNIDPTVELFTRYEEERSVWEELMREITKSLGEELTLDAFLQELQMHSKEASPQSNAVTLMTIHGAKGKEFHHVYLIGLVEDELPSFQSKQKGDNSPEMEEERRNCFVAITRTIESLTLSYAKEYRNWSKEPSRFLLEMELLNG